MIFVFIAVSALLCLGVLFRRYQTRERRKELLWMRRHASDYQETHKSPW
jgi:hypothetical protein